MRGMVWSERGYAQFGQSFADPWSDQRIAAFVLASPQWVINRTSSPKILVRQAMRGIMPEEARVSARKISPGPQYLHALRVKGRSVIEDLITDPKIERLGYVDGSALRDHYETVLAGHRAHACLWWALTLETWLRLYWREAEERWAGFVA